MRKDERKYQYDRLELWQLISQYLEQLGWSQAFLAKEADISESDLSHLKRGNQGIKPEKLTRIYEKFNEVEVPSFTFDAPEFRRVAELDIPKRSPDYARIYLQNGTVAFDIFLEGAKTRLPQLRSALYLEGKASRVEKETRSIYGKLLEMIMQADDLAIAELASEYGILIGQALEMGYVRQDSWKPALKIYMQVEDRLLRRFTLNLQRAKLYGALASLRNIQSNLGPYIRNERRLETMGGQSSRSRSIEPGH